MDELKQLRQKIDTLDGEILRLFAERAEVCREIGVAKKEQRLPVRDTSREAQVYQRIRDQAAHLGLNPVQVEAVYREIVNMCSSVQE
jgi:chorismate mutase/prephenate dehydratase